MRKHTQVSMTSCYDADFFLGALLS